jgi:biopolymer transport protein ExbB/biopolymer transport protein TolQ
MDISWKTIMGLGGIAWGVIGTLLVMSVLSIAITVERWWTYGVATRQSRRCAPELARLLKQGKLDAALETARSRGAARSHLAHMLAAGLQEWGDRRGDDDRDYALEATRLAAQHAAEGELAELRQRLTALATIGSTAPFVGLFGTTFGIINAFSKMGHAGAGGFAEISTGISEALVTTAFGLFVAIPAIWAYNSFSARLSVFETELARSRYQLVVLLEKSVN